MRNAVVHQMPATASLQIAWRQHGDETAEWCVTLGVDDKRCWSWSFGPHEACSPPDLVIINRQQITLLPQYQTQLTRWQSVWHISLPQYTEYCYQQAAAKVHWPKFPTLCHQWLLDYLQIIKYPDCVPNQLKNLINYSLVHCLHTSQISQILYNFWVILLTSRQTNQSENNKHAKNITEVIISEYVTFN